MGSIWTRCCYQTVSLWIFISRNVGHTHAVTPNRLIPCVVTSTTRCTTCTMYAPKTRYSLMRIRVQNRNRPPETPPPPPLIHTKEQKRTEKNAHSDRLMVFACALRSFIVSHCVGVCLFICVIAPEFCVIANALPVTRCLSSCNFEFIRSTIPILLSFDARALGQFVRWNVFYQIDFGFAVQTMDVFRGAWTAIQLRTQFIASANKI